MQPYAPGIRDPGTHGVPFPLDLLELAAEASDVVSRRSVPTLRAPWPIRPDIPREPSAPN